MAIFVPLFSSIQRYQVTATFVLPQFTQILLFLGIQKSYDRLKTIENIMVISQTLPILVIITVTIIIETYIFDLLGYSPDVFFYSLLPVSVSLFFPSFVYANKAINDIEFEVKALLRVWEPPQSWAKIRIYIPLALPHLLTGLKVSASWAVVATLITEGYLNRIEGNLQTLGALLIRPFGGAHKSGQTLCAILIACLLGFIIFKLFDYFQRFSEYVLFGGALKEREFPLG